jgi:hypothetical protein
MHRSNPPSDTYGSDGTSAWSACVEGYMFIVINEGGRGSLDLVPLRDDDGAPLPCSPRECAVGGHTPYYRVRRGRLVKGSSSDPERDG